jgi:membrane protein implicated in regulation of membrane protease activity
MALAYWHWLVFGMLLVVFEIFIPSFTALWFGLGALIVGFMLYLSPGVPLFWQLLVWLIASSVFTWAWFRFFRRLAPDRTKAGLSREAIIGETAQVIRAPQEDSRGMLRFATPKLGSEEWEFLCEQPVVMGDRVIVKDVSGNTLIVTRR